jgi:hypothetical protein
VSRSLPSQFLQPQWFIPLFVCLWLAISAVLALAGGWFSLSREFRADDVVEGERFGFASGSMGLWPFPVTVYRNSLFLTVNDSGFRLSVLFLFRFLSAPLFIPWSAVKAIETGRFLFVRYTLVRLNRRWPAVALRGEAGECLAQTYERVSHA